MSKPTIVPLSRQTRPRLVTALGAAAKKATVADLRKACKALGVKGYSRQKKAWLIEHCSGDKAAKPKASTIGGDLAKRIMKVKPTFKKYVADNVPSAVARQAFELLQAYENAMFIASEFESLKEDSIVPASKLRSLKARMRKQIPQLSKSWNNLSYRLSETVDDEVHNVIQDYLRFFSDAAVKATNDALA